jgi:hypothetical protein
MARQHGALLTHTIQEGGDDVGVICDIAGSSKDASIEQLEIRVSAMHRRLKDRETAHRGRLTWKRSVIILLSLLTSGDR